MASVINTNIAATRTHNVYSRNNDYMNAAMTRVATGMKINSAKDGASTWAISEKMRERIRANDQANQNIQNDTALLKTAQGGVSNTIDILKTLKERAINSLNDSNMNTDRDRIATEVEQLLLQIDDNAAKVKFNGRTLLDGTGGTDTTGGNFTAGASSSVTEPTAATFSTTDTGNSAVFSLTSLGSASTDKLTDLGFAEGDVITFSWVEDGASSATTKSITVAADTTVGGLTFTESKLKVSYEAASTPLSDQNSNAVTGTAATTTTAGLYAVGAKQVTITDFKVGVVDSDGNTNSTAQTAMVFSGLQQSTGVVASHSVSSITGLTDGDASNAATSSTKFVNIWANGATAGIGNGDTLTITVGSETQDISVGTNTAISGNLGTWTNANVAWYNAGDAILDKNGDAVTKSDGTALTASAAGIYAIGAEGETVDISISSDGTLNNVAFSSVQAAGDKASDSSGSSSGSTTSTTSGTSTSLQFYIGGEENFGITATINSMTVSSLFSGYDSGSFATLFTTKDDANTALGLINTALDTALNEQTKLGAMENRLGYASDNIVTMNENLEAADSVMRDSDIAKEMTNYMKYAVLSQASQYMLAQAGQNAFQVLNLLQQ